MKVLSLFFILTLLLTVVPSLHSAYVDPGGTKFSQNNGIGKTGTSAGKTGPSSKK